jgi:ketosteroid isomerase-like protein
VNGAEAFRKAVEAADAEALVATLADDVVFRSPAVHKPYEGKTEVSVILRAVVRVLEDFRYTEVYGEGSAHVLQFEARVGDRALEGADFLHTGDDGLVRDLRVMIRPLSGLNALVAGMQQAIPEVVAELSG